MKMLRANFKTIPQSLPVLLLLAAGISSAQVPNDARPAAWGQWQAWGDQGDGTYRNPVLPSDYSDIDCIRVGADYYAVSSTFQSSPGMVVLHSRDLVNWRILSHVVHDLTRISPGLNWDRMNRYARGIWAGAIRHHAGKFWVYFGTPDEGYFMSTATNAAGPWEPLHRMTKDGGWDDCCPFWDDDGQGYFAGTHFAGGYKTYLYKLSPDGRDIITMTARLINSGVGREANKLYKINGWYYHLFSEHKGNLGRYLMMQRYKSIFGPYAEVKQLAYPGRDANEPNQGGLVQTEKGEWYFFTHHGTGAWEGRCASLLPVTWIDGWPIIGEIGPDGLGRMVWSGKKPDSAISRGRIPGWASVRRAVSARWNSESTTESGLAPRLPATPSGCGPHGVGMVGASMHIASMAAYSPTSVSRTSSLGGITGEIASASTTSTTNPTPDTWMSIGFATNTPDLAPRLNEPNDA